MNLLLLPLSVFFACSLVLLVVWSILAIVADAFMTAQQMHKIPCANCRFFTHDYHLKCTVHPQSALSEAAIDCPDYRPPVDLGVPY
jgi:hypothetical protein